MTLEIELLKEAEGHLRKMELFIDSMDLNRTFGESGNEAGAILYHTAESTKFWLNGVILGNPHVRDREAEFQKGRSLEEIQQSFREAFELIQLVGNTKIDLSQPVDLKGLKPSPDIQHWNVAKTLIHISTHVAYHHAQLQGIQRLYPK